MKGRIVLGISLLILAALLSVAGISSATGKSDTGKVREERLITVMSPAISTRFAERVPLGPRAGSLEGKTLFLVDMQWGGPDAGYSVFEEMQAWFAKNMPSIKTEIRRISGGPFSGDDEALRKEIAAKKAGGVVIGIGG